MKNETKVALKKASIMTALVVVLLFEAIVTLFFFAFHNIFTTPNVHPDMVEYSKEEILNVAKEKYDVTEWVYSNSSISGTAQYDENGAFKLNFSSYEYSKDFVNGDNIEKAFTSFAGVNGNYETQKRYSDFLCRVAIGKCSDNTYKFVYYNTNINKNEKIADTIGASDYTLEVSPGDIDNSLFNVPSNWSRMQEFLNQFKDSETNYFRFTEDLLTLVKYPNSSESKYSYANDSILTVEFYKENGKVVYDVYYIKDRNKPLVKDIIYSTSQNYGVIYNYYGLDKSQYFDVGQSVYQSEENEDYMILQGNVTAKNIGGPVYYSYIEYFFEYLSYKEDKDVVDYFIETKERITSRITFTDTLRYSIKKTKKTDHSKTSKFYLGNFYILYKKSTTK